MSNVGHGVRIYGRMACWRSVAAWVAATLVASSLAGCCSKECMRCLVGCYDTVDDGRAVIPSQGDTRQPPVHEPQAAIAY